MYWPYRGDGDHCGSRINGSRTVAVVRRRARAIARTAPPILTAIMAAARVYYGGDPYYGGNAYGASVPYFRGHPNAGW
jgi:hypothetical protein